MTDSFGISLRRARERRQISIADIAARTKIKASLFEEIERDDPSHWPAGIFRRSFMREYARAIGLDPDETVREFLRCFPDPADAAAEEVSRAVAEAKTGAPRTPSTPVRPGPVAAGTARKTTGAVRQERSAAADGSAAVAAAAHRSAAHTAAGLRLTLVETALPLTSGHLLADVQKHWRSAACDGASVLAMALIAFVFSGSFWMPFSVAAVAYYVGGVLLLGNTPGVCLFARRPKTTGASGTPARFPRSRHADPVGARHGEPAFRTRRWTAKRSELST